MNSDAIRGKLAVLAKRDWPEEWGSAEAARFGDFYGWCHRYRLEEPLGSDQVAAFEQQHGITLPQDYRIFLVELGNGGAGPDYGIFPLGEGEEEPLWPGVLERLGEEFAHSEAWNDTSLREPSEDGVFIPLEAYYSDDVMAGALPIATRGCALDYWMVVTGPSKGEIWFDKRTDGEGVEPVVDEAGDRQTFGPWFEAWLDEACRMHGLD